MRVSARVCECVDLCIIVCTYWMWSYIAVPVMCVRLWGPKGRSISRAEPALSPDS